MTKGRNLVIDIPKYLLDQISLRAKINDRTRNAEIRYLVEVGLGYVGANDTSVTIPSRSETQWSQSICRLSLPVYSIVRERATEFHRGVGREVVRLVAHALEETARRDLAVIHEMIARQGSAVRHPQ